MDTGNVCSFGWQIKWKQLIIEMRVRWSFQSKIHCKGYGTSLQWMLFAKRWNQAKVVLFLTSVFAVFKMCGFLSNSILLTDNERKCYDIDYNDLIQICIRNSVFSYTNTQKRMFNTNNNKQYIESYHLHGDGIYLKLTFLSD